MRTCCDFSNARLDNVVYRMGSGATRAESRQLVNHKAVMVNGRCVNIASYQVGLSDVVSIREKARRQQRIQDFTRTDRAVRISCLGGCRPGEDGGRAQALPDREDLPRMSTNSL